MQKDGKKLRGQLSTLLEFLRQRGHVTHLQAWRLLGISRLAARIHDLRKQGYKIKTEMVPMPCRNNVVEVARYHLEEEKHED